mmetsp:Transcript_25229/g.25567  ORF Transcript_25229/g.25567 Transcript_25229/m.25567 type:complete len:127 (+) Transcript_25229:338-718(+)
MVENVVSDGDNENDHEYEYFFLGKDLPSILLMCWCYDAITKLRRNKQVVYPGRVMMHGKKFHNGKAWIQKGGRTFQTLLRILPAKANRMPIFYYRKVYARFIGRITDESSSTVYIDRQKNYQVTCK